MGGQRNKRKKSRENGSPSPSSEPLTSQLVKPSTDINPFKPSAKKSVAESMTDVFNNNLIREKIVRHVIRDELKKGASRSDVCALRLIAKSWLQDVHKILHKWRVPLYKIRLTRENSLNASPNVQQNGYKLLDEVTGAIKSYPSLDTRVPLIRLTIQPQFFRHENHQSFSNFLAECGTALQELEMWIPENCGGSMTFMFPGVSLYFPYLSILTLDFTQRYFAGIINEEEMAFCSSSSWVTLPFIQSILSGAQDLAKLNLSSKFNRTCKIPQGIRYLTLPSSIISLNLSGVSHSSVLEALLNSNIPSLQQLTFCIFAAGQGLVSKILEKFRTTLRALSVRERKNASNSQNPVSPNVFRFPLMGKLESCEILCPYLALEDGHPLQDLLPKLKYLNLCYQTIEETQKWTRYSTFHYVTSLAYHPISQSGQLRDLNFKSHFPNVVKLLVVFTKGAEVDNLKQIFMDMTKLQSLTVILNDGLENEDTKLGHLDSLFIGLPEETADELRRNPNYSQSLHLKDPILSSIANLKELENLKLISLPTSSGESLISDLAFQFGFLQMPKLKRILLGGGFTASEEMARVWRDQGCILTLLHIERIHLA